MAKSKVLYTRRNLFSGLKFCKSYLECLKKYYNAVDKTFDDAIQEE